MQVSKEILGYLTERSNFSLVQEQKLARIRHFHNMADTVNYDKECMQIHLFIAFFSLTIKLCFFYS